MSLIAIADCNIIAVAGVKRTDLIDLFHKYNAPTESAWHTQLTVITGFIAPLNKTTKLSLQETNNNFTSIA